MDSRVDQKLTTGTKGISTDRAGGVGLGLEDGSGLVDGVAVRPGEVGLGNVNEVLVGAAVPAVGLAEGGAVGVGSCGGAVELHATATMSARMAVAAA
jgi:hypothetical protein